jgi:hypothetical protein
MAQGLMSISLAEVIYARMASFQQIANSTDLLSLAL